MSWCIVDCNAPALFSSLASVSSLEGETVTRAKTRDLLRVVYAGETYYIKRYWTAGKGMRAYFFRSRVRAEWENLLYFKQCNIAAPDLVAYGETRSCLNYHYGSFVMHALDDSVKALDILLSQPTSALERRHWLRQVAEGMRRLHDQHFIHGDCFVRNFLVSTSSGTVYFTDCPRGRRMWGPFFDYGRVRDLASFYKGVRYLLSRTDQLRLLLWYQGERRFTPENRVLLKAVLQKVG